MAYKIEFLPHAVKQLAKFDKTAQRRVIAYLENRVAGATVSATIAPSATFKKSA